LASESEPSGGARPDRRAERWRRRQDLRKLGLGLCFLAPALITLSATFLYPVAYNLWLSVHAYNLAEIYLGTHFVGLDNFIAELSDPYFWDGLRNSAVITVGCLALELPIGMALALALNRPGRSLAAFRVLFILPLLLIPAVTAYMWRFMFQYDGIINYLLELVDLGPINWSTTTAGLASVVIVVVWQNAAFSFIIFLAGLQSVDPELWAAAKVDGAGPVQRFVYVTLPAMRPFILVVLVIRTMDLIRLFDEGYVLTGGAPARATETLSHIVYTDTFTLFDIGQGSAITVIQGLIVVASILAIFVTVGRRRDGA
jgi:multiple sugar transport system permease protein